MPGIFYAVVEDDPLTSGGRVYADGTAGTIEGPDGRHRRMAFIGDTAYCEACKSIGTIVRAAPTSKRLIDMTRGGRLQAVNGDSVLCKCPNPPTVVALHGRKWMIIDAGDPRGAAPARPVQNATYDEQYTLTGFEGRPLRGVRYRVLAGSIIVATGVTDAHGRTSRISTDNSQRLRLEVAH
ncbi:PAAR domain-containing protein [Paraburkholderia sp. DHOC27]|uniref:PAAR domain-containing protein n=1 Tax=Paraburkholderia sp. DHOC27 TaxID=2303330 RepID=UPI000E3C277F|nr:PAAR domain-containing protein [Paraburkholderia sp. DHOC27]RFU48902.1 PAAR domain-containing protein [Paraburkholderia sp. DHOC27]